MEACAALAANAAAAAAAREARSRLQVATLFQVRRCRARPLVERWRALVVRPRRRRTLEVWAERRSLVGQQEPGAEQDFSKQNAKLLQQQQLEPHAAPNGGPDAGLQNGARIVSRRQLGPFLPSSRPAGRRAEVAPARPRARQASPVQSRLDRDRPIVRRGSAWTSSGSSLD